MTQVTMCPTKAGRGYKVVVDGTWFYTSTQELSRMLRGESNACKFRTIDEIQQNEAVEVI